MVLYGFVWFNIVLHGFVWFDGVSKYHRYGIELKNSIGGWLVKWNLDWIYQIYRDVVVLLGL